MAVLSWGAAPASGVGTPLAASPEAGGLRRGTCEAYYGARSGIPYGRYKPRYGHCWWW
jgi:hypothetical protein